MPGVTVVSATDNCAAKKANFVFVRMYNFASKAGLSFLSELYVVSWFLLFSNGNCYCQKDDFSIAASLKNNLAKIWIKNLAEELSPEDAMSLEKTKILNINVPSVKKTVWNSKAVECKKQRTSIE